MRPAGLWPLAALALAACGAPADPDAAEAPVDSSLAAVLADLHLAHARAETTGEPLDSLQALAYREHATDSSSVHGRLRRAVGDPDAASALYGAVADRLDPLPAPPR